MAVFRSCNLIAHKCREVISLSTPSYMERLPDDLEGLSPLELLQRPVPDWCMEFLTNRISGEEGDSVLESRLLTRSRVARARMGKDF